MSPEVRVLAAPLHRPSNPPVDFSALHWKTPAKVPVSVLNRPMDESYGLNPVAKAWAIRVEFSLCV